MLSRDEHDGIVAQLYAAALGDAPWSAMLGHLAALFGHSAAVLALVDSAGTVVGAQNHGYSSVFAAEYFASDVFASDPRTPYHSAVRPGAIYYDRCLYDAEEMLRDPRCRLSTDILGLAHQLGAVMRLPHGGKAYLTLLSSPEQGQASDATVAAFHRIAPFAEQACALGQVVDLGAATQWALIEALALKVDGVILLDRSGVPLFVNDAAGDILSAGDGFALSDGRFVACRGPETRRLQTLIDATIANGLTAAARTGGHALITRPSGLRPYVVRVMPAPPIERFLTSQSIACILYITDLAAVATPSKPILRDTFGLSCREADLAMEMVRTGNLASAAAAAGMALNTARNHLHSIFGKSGTTSQAELVQLFGRLI